MTNTKKQTNLSLFSNNTIDTQAHKLFDSIESRVEDGQRWWSIYSAIEVIVNPKGEIRQFYFDMKRNDKGIDELAASDFFRQCYEKTPGNRGFYKPYLNAKGMFRFIQSLSSKKAEPFKLWLAQAGYERVEEEHNPDLIIDRGIKTYRKHGVSEEDISTRMLIRQMGKEKRKECTSSLSASGIVSGKDYAAITNDIYRQTLYMNAAEIRRHKGLKAGENTRPHFQPIEGTGVMTSEDIIAVLCMKKGAKNMEDIKAITKFACGLGRNTIEKMNSFMDEDEDTTKNNLTDRQIRMRAKAKIS